MHFAALLKEVFSREELLAKPPVLLDIGASGEINSKWEAIAPYSICIAADADDREMVYTESLDTRFNKLYIIHRIVTAENQKEVDFYLTSSPYCSSSLPPATEALEPWEFRKLFSVDSRKKFSAISVHGILSELRLDYVDWFKTDSQGTDLRLFKSLPEDCASRVLAAEFEPGIIDAYSGEDKLWQVLKHMDRLNFWMSGFTLCGQRRLPEAVTAKKGLDDSRLRLRISPGWSELTYLNKMVNAPELWTKREYLLAWVFGCIEQQFGFAAEVAALGGTRHPDAIFGAMEEFAYRGMTRQKTVKEYALRATRWVLRKVERMLDAETT